METFNQPVFGFVVLHYMAYDMTCQCVNTLLSISDGRNVPIVVVDNGSPNGSGSLLQQKFTGHASVHVILTGENLGFARGNDAGFRFIKEHFDCQFIAVINNDLLIRDARFFDWVEDTYRQTGFSVLGPDIVNPASGRHQNPSHRDNAELLYGYSRQQLEKTYDAYSRNARNFCFNRLKWRIKTTLFPSAAQRRPYTPATVDGRMENVVLHGSCLVFSPLFLLRRDDCFNPATFLYMEEDILHFECKRDGLKMVYDSSFRVEHLEDVSTDTLSRSKLKKEKMKLRETVRSMRVLLNLMNDA